MLGPDVKPVLIPPDEIKAIAEDADDQGLLASGVLAIVQEAADIAPAVPDSENRLTIWSTETVKNLVIEAFAIALNNPKTSIAVLASVAMVEVGFNLVNAAVAAGFLLRQQDWIETQLGNSPTWRALFKELCDWMSKHGPPK